VWQGGYEPKHPRCDEQGRADCGVEEQDDAARSADACHGRAGDPEPDQRHLQRLTTARREIGVRGDAGGVGCADIEQPYSCRRVRGAEDVAPGERSAAQVGEVEEQRNEDPAGVERGDSIRECVQRCEGGVQAGPSRRAEG
jgi:hypothetical protein